MATPHQPRSSRDAERSSRDDERPPRDKDAPFSEPKHEDARDKDSREKEKEAARGRSPLRRPFRDTDESVG
jgi:hypothetical protein